jgi:sialate O-acetylesterase
MVLQRSAQAPVWGWDAPGTDVIVSFRGGNVSAHAGPDGRFEALVPTGTAGGPFTLDISGTDTVHITDVLVGDVWIAAGQSNMWWPLKDCTGAREAIANSDIPQLHWFDANSSNTASGWQADTPQRTVKGAWVTSAPDVAGKFSGPAFFFARELHAQLKVPIGIVNVSVPGTSIEQWLRPAILQSQFPDAVELHELRAMTYTERHQAWQNSIAAWSEDDAKAKADGQKEPAKPEEPVNDNFTLGGLWNGTVAPVVPFGAKGFLWWQGENNAYRSADYRVRFPALIEDWRHQWGLDTAPWIYVVLANFGTRSGSEMEDAPWPALRDAQKSALALKNVYRVSAIDILSEPTWQIHPPNKAQTGHRLFLAAMANVYGQAKMAWSGPDVEQITFHGSSCKVTMQDASGLRVRGGGGPVRGFVLAGKDRVWHDAEAHLEGDTVVVTSPDVPVPVAVRYAWMNNPDANMENSSGLPAWPFRSDDWPLCDTGAG